MLLKVILFALFMKGYHGVDGVDNEKPNIVMIMADDMGWNDVGFHGSSQIPTPNIDALGYNGVIFDKYYAQQACTPSRAALLTGNYPIRSGFQGIPMRAGENRKLPASMPTLPTKLKELGYSTHLIGKWHLGHAFKNATPLGHGYDTFYGYYNGYISYFDHDISQFPLHNGVDFHRDFEPIVTEKGKYVTDLLAEETENVISKSKNGEPFFIFLSHLAPHTGKTISNGVTVLEVADIDEVNRKYAYIKDKNRRKYADVVQRLDASIGRVIKALSDKDLLKNTIVIFISDNGGQTFGIHENFASNWPLRGLKFTLFEGGVKVPAVIYSTKIKNRGTINRNLFHITDWLPTLYSAAGNDDHLVTAYIQPKLLKERYKNNTRKTDASETKDPFILVKYKANIKEETDQLVNTARANNESVEDNWNTVMNVILHPGETTLAFLNNGGNPADLGQIDGIDQWENIVDDNRINFRKEILLNIDEAFHFSGIVGYNGQYKLINNSYANNIYDNYTGDSGRQFLPLYNTKNVLQSETNKAIKKLKDTYPLNWSSIYYLQKQVTMQNCRPIKPAKVCTGICLFNLLNDPCEGNDISAQHPEIVQSLWNRIQEFETQLVPQQNTVLDMNADPSLCRDTWFNWLEKNNSGCWYNNIQI